MVRGYDAVVLGGVAQARQAPLDLAPELVEHPVDGDAGSDGGAHHVGLLGAVEALEQRQQPVEVEGEGRLGHG
jgi:hypothetical protein